MARLDAAVDRVFARPRQIADRLVFRVGDPYSAQLTGTARFGQLNAVASVGLDPVARPPRNLRGRDDLANVALGRQCPLQSEPGRTGLVDDVKVLGRADLGQHLQKLADVVRHLADESPRRSALLGRRNGDAVLVDVQAHMKFDTLFHGRSPCC